MLLLVFPIQKHGGQFPTCLEKVVIIFDYLPSFTSMGIYKLLKTVEGDCFFKKFRYTLVFYLFICFVVAKFLLFVCTSCKM